MGARANTSTDADRSRGRHPGQHPCSAVSMKCVAWADGSGVTAKPAMSTLAPSAASALDEPRSCQLISMFNALPGSPVVVIVSRAGR